MLVTATLSADMRYPTYPVVWAKQGDRLARKLAVGLYDGGVSWTPPGSGVAYAVRFRKPDGTIGYYDTDERGNAAVSVSGSVATVTLAQQALACPGRVEMDLDVYTTTGTVAEHLSTFSWAVMVEAAPCGMDSSDYINVTDGAARRQAIAQDYSATATYAVGAYCIQNHLLYRCTVAISTPEAWNAAHWTSVRVMEEVVRLDGILDAKIDSTAATLQGYIAPAFASGSHRKGEMCFRLGVLYCCNTSYVGSGSMAWREQFWNVVSVSDVVRGLRSDVDGLERSKADVYALLLTNKKLNYLARLTKGQVWDVEAGTTPAYQHTVPNGAKAVAVNGVGGKTVVFNQLAKYTNATRTARGLTYTNNNDGSWTITGSPDGSNNYFCNLSNSTTGSFEVEPGHKAFIGAVSNDFVSVVLVGDNTSESGAGTELKTDRILTVDSSAPSAWFRIQVLNSAAGVTFNRTIRPQIFDLTKKFGAGSEPSTVEQFKAMFPEDYYPYNTGSLLSANVTSVESKSFYKSMDLGSVSWVYQDSPGPIFWRNFSDKENGIGNILCAMYENTTSPSYSAMPNMSIKGDEAGKGVYIKNTTYTDAASFKAAMSGVTLYYEPAAGVSPDSLGTLTIPQALRTAYPLHSAGTVYDEYDIERKKFIQRVGVVDMGTLGWLTYNNRFVCRIIGIAKKTQGQDSNLVCVRYATYPAGSSASGADKGIYKEYGADTAVYVYDTGFSDVASLKASLSGVYLYYELATPVETDISQYFDDDNLLTVEAGGTLTFTQSNAVTSNLSVPNDTEYAVKLSDAV